MKQVYLTIEKNEKLTRDVLRLTLTGDASGVTNPGQFVNIAIDGFYLRRPISVCDVEGDIIRLVFEVRGEGTELLSHTKVGENINIIAPLGKGFTLDPDKKTIFIGGGIGVPPMLYSAKQCGKNATQMTEVSVFTALSHSRCPS